MPMYDVRELTKPRPGFLYEPRVLWGMGYITKAESEGQFLSPATVVLPGRDSYFNGSRWPIVLTDVITLVQSPLGYGVAGPSLIDQIPIELSALGGARYSLGQVRGLVQPKASHEAQEGVSVIDYDPVPMANLVTAVAQTVAPRATTRPVTNLARWDFEHTLKLPPAAYLELQLAGRIPTPIDTSAVKVKADVNFYAAAPNEGAQWPGSTITRTNFDVSQLTVAAAQTYYQAALAQSLDGDYPAAPFATLPFQGLVDGPASQLYPPAQVFSSRQAVQQKATYDLPTNLHGFSVGFEQNALDVALLAGGAQLTGPLSTTTYARCRSRNGGTQNYWWRDGAPLAICTPTMTPGTVSTLSRPLALQPGEGFKLALPTSFDPDSLTLPFSCNVGAGAGLVRLSQAVFYISFCGYAVVEA